MKKLGLIFSLFLYAFVFGQSRETSTNKQNESPIFKKIEDFLNLIVGRENVKTWPSSPTVCGFTVKKSLDQCYIESLKKFLEKLDLEKNWSIDKTTEGYSFVLELQQKSN